MHCPKDQRILKQIATTSHLSAGFPVTPMTRGQTFVYGGRGLGKLATASGLYE